ncbi:MAG: sulfotransferase [Sphingobium sp.]
MAMNAIFVGGSPRSGTTLLGTLLQCIPGACVTDESPFKDTVRWANFEDENQFKNAIANDHKFKHWNIAGIENIECPSEREFYQLLLTKFHGTMPSYWIDHTPANIRSYGRLKSIFPEAKFIHLVRDGRAVANSVMPLEWGANTPAAAAKQWMEDVAIGLATQVMHPEDVTMVKYETLVAKPVDTINNLFAFLGIDHRISGVEELNLDASFLPQSMRVGQHKNVGKLPNPSNANKWQTQLHDRDVAKFEHYARGLLVELGYPARPPGKRPSKISLLRGMIAEKWLSRVINPPKYRAIRGIE